MCNKTVARAPAAVEADKSVSSQVTLKVPISSAGRMDLRQFFCSIVLASLRLSRGKVGFIRFKALYDIIQVNVYM